MKSIASTDRKLGRSANNCYASVTDTSSPGFLLTMQGELSLTIYRTEILGSKIHIHNLKQSGPLATQPDFPYNDGEPSDDDSKLPDDDSASVSSVQSTPYIPPLRSKL